MASTVEEETRSSLSIDNTSGFNLSQQPLFILIDHLEHADSRYTPGRIPFMSTTTSVRLAQ